MPYELWSTDLFDRDSEPMLEASFSRLDEGLSSLWRKVLDEMIQDDGRPGFTDFSLRGEGRVVSIPRDPFENPLLAELRRRARADTSFLPRLVAEHQQRFRDRPVVLETLLLALTPVPQPLERALVVISRRLGFEPRLTLSEGRWGGPRLTLTAAWARSGASTWRLSVGGLDAPFVVTHSGDVTAVEGAGGAAEVLKDALLEAGVLPQS